MPGADEGIVRETAEAVARRSYGKLVAFLAARTGDVAGAEDALSEAFAAALVDWPASGVPNAPEAWLVTVARRKLIDPARRRRSSEESADGGQLPAEVETEAESPDQRRRLMFACAHPAIGEVVGAPPILPA